MAARRLFMLITIVLVGFSLTSCTLPAISQLDVIVATAEAVIPFILKLSADDAEKTRTYVDGTLKVADDLLGKELTTATLAKAVGDFNANLAPAITDPKVENMVFSISAAVQTFLNNYTGTVVQATYAGTDRNSYDAALRASYIRTLVPAKKTIRVSIKDKARLDKIHARIKAARAKLKK